MTKSRALYDQGHDGIGNGMGLPTGYVQGVLHCEQT